MSRSRPRRPAGVREASAAFQLSATSAAPAKELRARAVRHGLQALDESETLQLLVARAAPRRAEALAAQLMARFGGLARVLGASLPELMQVVDEPIALELKLLQDATRRVLEFPLRRRSVLGSWSAVAAYLQASLGGQSRESFRVLFLDRGNGLIVDELMGAGTVDHAPVYPREVARRALELAACGCCLVHNHPRRSEPLQGGYRDDPARGRGLPCARRHRARSLPGRRRPGRQLPRPGGDVTGPGAPAGSGRSRSSVADPEPRLVAGPCPAPAWPQGRPLAGHRGRSAFRGPWRPGAAAGRGRSRGAAQPASPDRAPALQPRPTIMTPLTPDLSTYDDLRRAADDGRDHPEQAALEQLGEVLMTETLDVIADTALEDHVTAIAEGLIGAFQSISLRLQRDWDRAADEVKRLSRDFDGSEVADVELQEATRRAQAAEAAIRAVELVRDRASETYTLATGEVWTPWRGSTRRNGSTAAQIDAREALRAKRAKALAAVEPGAFVVAFRGAPTADTALDAGRIYDALNWALQQWPEMKLTTSNCSGAERLAVKWARDHHVDHVLTRLDKAKHSTAAPFRVNDEMLALEPVIVLTLPNSLDEARAAASRPFGPALNLGQKAQERGVRHLAISLRKAG